jgi:phage terminase large subunit-like protein
LAQKQPKFKETAKQLEANKVIGSDATNCLLFGGSRSGKTFKWVRAICVRAIASPGSRHAILRFRFNAAKTSIALDTLPKVMSLCFSQIKYHLDKTDWYFEFPNKSEIWIGGLDDKERTEKILGHEFATIYLNECSQISYSARNMAVTRLAQNCTHDVGGKNVPLRRKMLYDCNPSSQAHWSYQIFIKHRDPDTKQPVDPSDYASMVMNPVDNTDNLPAGYIDSLASLPGRLRVRFLDGQYAPVAEGALWTIEGIETWRTLSDLPDMQRVVVSVDPSGSGDEDNADNDAIGIIVAGLGIDGNGYVLEDLTCKAGPSVWGNVATTAYDRHRADCVVGEINYGGAMVEHVIQTSRKRTPYKKVTATRGKVVRSEPISALAEKGKIRHAGNFPELEDELTAFTTRGYMGPESPNRADAYVWAFTELFGQIVEGPRKKVKVFVPQYSGLSI